MFFEISLTVCVAYVLGETMPSYETDAWDTSRLDKEISCKQKEHIYMRLFFFFFSFMFYFYSMFISQHPHNCVFPKLKVVVGFSFRGGDEAVANGAAGAAGERKWKRLLPKVWVRAKQLWRILLKLPQK